MYPRRPAIRFSSKSMSALLARASYGT